METCPPMPLRPLPISHRKTQVRLFCLCAICQFWLAFYRQGIFVYKFGLGLISTLLFSLAAATERLYQQCCWLSPQQGDSSPEWDPPRKGTPRPGKGPLPPSSSRPNTHSPGQSVEPGVNVWAVCFAVLSSMLLLALLGWAIFQG